MIDQTQGRVFRTSALLAAGLVVGCSTDGYQVEAAVKACAAHGGVTEMFHDLWERNVRCMDGAFFPKVGTTK